MVVKNGDLPSPYTSKDQKKKQVISGIGVFNRS